MQLLERLHQTLVLLCAAYLRRAPIVMGKQWLLNWCRQLATRLPAFTADVRAFPWMGRTCCRMRCFQLGGEYHADVLSEWLFYSGSWQPSLTAYLHQVLQPGDVMVDVGANTGYFTLLGAALGATVVAVEACPKTFERLAINIGLNPSIAARIRPLQVAAAEAAGEATLYQHKRDALYNTTVAGAGAGGVAAATDVWAVLQAQGSIAFGSDAAGMAAISQLAAETAVWRELRVPKATLDNLLTDTEAQAARIIKIDVEGAELSVLRGLRQLLDAASKRCAALEVVVEVTPKWLMLSGSKGAAQLLDLMSCYGFHPYIIAEEDYDIACVAYEIPGFRGIRPRRLRDAEQQLNAIKQVDVVFSRKDAEWL